MKQHIIKYKYIIIFVLIIIVLILLTIYVYPIAVYHKYENEFHSISKQITADTCLQIYNSYSILAYSDFGENKISELNDLLKKDINNVFSNKNISYIGWGCPVKSPEGKLTYCWSNLFIGINKNNTRKYLVYCPDDNNTPDFSRYGKIKTRYISDNWLCISIEEGSYVLIP